MQSIETILTELPLQPVSGDWCIFNVAEKLPGKSVLIGSRLIQFDVTESYLSEMFYFEKGNRYFAKVNGAVYSLAIQKKIF